MDFNNFKAIKQANSESTRISISQDKPSISLEGQSKKPKEAQGFHLYPKVYQGCDTCKTKMNHYILNGIVTCLGCKSSYKLVDRDKTVFNFERI